MVVSADALLLSAVQARARTRHASADDAVDGVLPRLVAEPDTPEALAAVLAWASRDRLSIVLRGGGTKITWGRRAEAIDLVVSMGRLNRVLAHEHGDLTTTVEAGATIGELNRQLARHGQWLPVDARGDQATIGGTIATNDSGPLRHRYGTPRDLLIGIRLATTDGRLVKAGGNVVKNVAGYDLGKLVSGSFGSLAAVVSATFKLAPLPVSSGTLVVPFEAAGPVAEAIARIAASQLEPLAFDLHVRATATAPSPRAPFWVLLRFASAPTATEVQIAQARALLAIDGSEVVTGEREIALWTDHVHRIWASPGAVIKASWLPAALPGALAMVDELRRSGARAVELVARAAAGSGLIRVDAEVSAQVAAVERLRACRDLFRHVVLLGAAPAVKARVDVWGPLGDAEGLARAVKRALDPTATLNAGRGPVS